MKILILILLSFIISVFFHIFRIKKKLLLTLFFFLLLFLLFLTLFKEKLILSFKIKTPLKIFLIEDITKSMPPLNTDSWDKFFDKKFFLANTISEKPEQLNNEISRIYDSLREFKRKVGDDTILVVI